MIRAESLSKSFGHVQAITDVSFEVQPGEIVGFLGPNGAGKTTTLRILAGVFPPTAGRATVAGFDVVRQPIAARRQVGYFPERIALHGETRVDEHLRDVTAMKGVTPAARRQQINWTMEVCGITSVAHRLIGTLSKGYKQRVGIAQALLGEPPVLLLDEPTAGLDPEQISEVRAFIRGLGGERAVILSTHILHEVELTCDRVIIIHRGRVLAVDTPRGLHERLERTPQVRLEVAGPPEEVRRTIAELPEVRTVERTEPSGSGTAVFTVTTEGGRTARRTLAAAVTARGWGLLELRGVERTLEDIFLQLVTERDQSPL